MTLYLRDISKDLPVHPNKKPSLRKISDIKRLVVHTTDWVIDPEKLALYDIGPNHISATGCPTITYTYMITLGGVIFKCTDYEVVTWHVGNWNKSSLGIALVYKTDPKIEKSLASGNGLPVDHDPHFLPTKEQMNALIQLLTKLCLELKLSPTEVFGHRELFGTGWFNDKGSKKLRKTCPGMYIALDSLRDTVIKLVQTKLQEANLYTGKIDGKWGPKSKQALQEYSL